MNLSLLLTALLATCQLSAQITNRPIAFIHANVIDVKSGATRANRTVIVQGNLIADVGPANTSVPANAQVVDASGKFLIPGLWDMHVHSFYPGRPGIFFPMFIANGVTGVREMGSSMSLNDINTIRRQIETGEITGPRIGAVAGKILDAEVADRLEFEAVTNEDEARQAVREHKAQGADFIKVYNLLSRDVYFAIADECKKQHIPFAGHLPTAIGAAEASDAGQQSMEHLVGLLTACTPHEKEFKQKQLSDTTWSLADGILDDYDPQKAHALFRKFAVNETWQCPTLSLFRPDTSAAGLKYIPPAIRKRWEKDFNEWKQPDAAKRWYAKYPGLIGEMNRYHVPLLAGTDAGWGNDFTFPGFGLHEELALFVEAGLSPLQALQTATVNAAKFLKKEEKLGTIEKGRIADMVLLDASPLDDIHNTKRIDAVIANGRYFSRADLDQLLLEAQTKANNYHAFSAPASPELPNTFRKGRSSFAFNRTGEDEAWKNLPWNTTAQSCPGSHTIMKGWPAGALDFVRRTQTKTAVFCN